MSQAPQELLLIGGGHTHALVLLEFARRPLRDTIITLISDVEHAPYSGMLPGHIAGNYTAAEMHIDLRRLCQRAGANFVLASVDGLDVGYRCALAYGERTGPVAGIISLNVGSTPDKNRVTGVAEWAIPSRPVPQLLAGWEKVKAAASKSAHPLRVIVIGAGAGGVELILAMQSQLRGRAEFTLVHSGGEIMSGHNAGVRRRLSAILTQRGVTMVLGQRVIKVKADSVALESGAWLPADFVFQVTQPAPPSWLQGSGLALTQDGFIRVKATLQSVNHPWVFAAGDVATIEDHPVPKSGVFAVRMAAPLARNLRAVLNGQPLQRYQPQKRFLSLIGTADGRAVASWSCLANHSKLMLRWKQWIDRRFMKQFENRRSIAGR